MVQSKYSSLFEWLVEFDTKQEVDKLDLATLDDQVDAENVGWMLKHLNINRSLLGMPQSACTASQSSSACLASSALIVIDIANLPTLSPLPPSSAIDKPTGHPSGVALGKRKAIDAPSDNDKIHVDDGVEFLAIAKRTRVGSITVSAAL